MIGIKWPTAVPLTEVSYDFLQGMASRMSQSWFKYGAVKDAYPIKVDAVASLLMRLMRYLGPERFQSAMNDALVRVSTENEKGHRRDHGNTEYLMDVANFAMIEFMHPRNPDAHFVVADSEESPGRAWTSGHVGQDANTHRVENNRIGGFYKRDGD